MSLVRDHTHIGNSRCAAVRCPCCGAYEHGRPHQAEFDCLAHDLFRSYIEGTNCGPGLAVQLNLATGRVYSRRPPEPGEKSRSKGPGSRPPGDWAADVSDLLADIHLNRHPDVDMLCDWRRQARSLLGFSLRPVHFPDAWCPACGEHTMWASPDAQSGAWCASGLCHDSDRHPECEQLTADDGVVRWSCRHTARALTHAHRWSANSLGWLFEQMARVAS